MCPQFLPPATSSTYMGCQQSRDEHLALRPSGAHNANDDDAAAARPRLSLSQLLLQHSKQQDTSGSHRDVFSIFGERGMVLEHSEHQHQPHNQALESSSCSPESPSGSVFSTATTASDSERTQVLQRTGQSFPGLQLRFGAFSDKGQRKQNEDRHVCVSERIHDDVVAFFGVYDGHGGSRVAEFLSQELHGAIFERMRNSPRDMKSCLVEAFVEADDVIFQTQMESGSTAVAVLLRGSTAIVASVGDSQAVLSTRGKALNYCPLHTPNSPAERERILAANGKISEGRIFGFLGVSRAFGDNDFKTGKGEFKDRFNGDLVIATPEIVEHEISKHDEFIVLACDGLFDVMSPQQVVDYVRKKLAQHGHVQHACEELVSHAISIGSLDNVSAVIVCFNREDHQARPAAGSASAAPGATAVSAEEAMNYMSSAPAAVAPLVSSSSIELEDPVIECKVVVTGAAVSAT